jgi:ABC-2 type transport system ATP-binding protein
MEAVVEVSGVTRRFGDTLALNAVNFFTQRGTVHGLVGVNGAGKTTLIKHLLGLLRPQQGTVRLFGMDPIRDLVPVLRRVGYLSEHRDLPEWMRVEDLLRYTQAYYPSWDTSYARSLLETFGLDPRKRCGDLSQGMRAQAGLIVAVAHRPELLLLDEPSSGLDAVVRHDILDAIVRTVADDGRTVIFSSHLLDEVERMSDHITLLHGGAVLLDGRVDDIRGSCRVSQARFGEAFDRAPGIESSLSVIGHGRSWSVTHTSSLDALRAEVARLGGEITESREATLEELFLGRVGRGARSRTAA